MAYDTKCHDLAEAFLEDVPHFNTPVRCAALAQVIQNAIEDYIASANREYDGPPDGDAWTGGFAENH